QIGESLAVNDGPSNLDLFPMIDGSDQNTCPAGVEVRNVHSDRRDTVLIGVRMKDQRPKARTEQFHHNLRTVNNPSTTAAANHHGHIGLCTAAKNIVADKLETEFRILGPVLTRQIADDADRVERQRLWQFNNRNVLDDRLGCSASRSALRNGHRGFRHWDRDRYLVKRT